MAAGDVWWSGVDLKWFDGYDGHKAAIFDDFRPDMCKLWMLLRLLDRYPLRIPIKGGFVQWRPTCIWITCPREPSDCYADMGEDIEQLMRRINVIKNF